MKTRTCLAILQGSLLLVLSEFPALATYNPQAGRWLNRDPFNESGWMLLNGDRMPLISQLTKVSPLYVFLYNNSIMYADLLGALTLTKKNDPSPINCGGGGIYTILFHLAPTEQNAYIIQEVTVTEVVRKCSGTVVSGYPKVTTYYEAWAIANESAVNDNFNLPAEANGTYGHKVMHGRAAFFWIGQLPPTFVPGSVSWAMGMPATETMPSFWGMTGSWISNYVTHTMHTSWSCCCGKKETQVWTTP